MRKRSRLLAAALLPFMLLIAACKMDMTVEYKDDGTAVSSVVFEDDGDTGYFYAASQDGILDALHIYNVEDVSDKHIPNHVLILWDDACTIAALCINGYIHAVYDFVEQAGYCRNGFPEADGEWVKVENRVLDDELLDKILSRKPT